MADGGEAGLAAGCIDRQHLERAGYRHANVTDSSARLGRRRVEKLAERQDPNFGPVADAHGLAPAEAVTAKAWPGIESGKAEGLGLGRLDDLPDVDAHGLEGH